MPHHRGEKGQIPLRIPHFPHAHEEVLIFSCGEMGKGRDGLIKNPSRRTSSWPSSRTEMPRLESKLDLWKLVLGVRKHAKVTHLTHWREEMRSCVGVQS